MHALGVGEVEVHRYISDDFLFELGVEGIDARVLIVLAEYANGGAKRNGSRRRRGNSVGPYGWRARRRSAKTTERERRRAGHAKLLGAVSGDGSYLRKHILPGVKDSPTGAQDRP